MRLKVAGFLESKFLLGARGFSSGFSSPSGDSIGPIFWLRIFLPQYNFLANGIFAGRCVWEKSICWSVLLSQKQPSVDFKLVCACGKTTQQHKYSRGCPPAINSPQRPCSATQMVGVVKRAMRATPADPGPAADDPEAVADGGGKWA